MLARVRPISPERQKGVIHGMMGTGAHFHSYNTNAMARMPPMLIMAMNCADDHAYVAPPPERGI
jgi:hypothetical protein